MLLRTTVTVLMLLCVVLDAHAQEKTYARVVSLYAAHAENLAAMGAGNVLVGVSEPLGALPVVTARDGAEAIAALNPDLVLARPMHKSTHPGLLQQLESMGITVVCLQPATPRELPDYWLTLGRLAGREAQAAGMVEHYKAGLEAVAKAVGSIPLEKRKRVFFETIHRQFKTVSPGSIAAFVLEAAGGVNVAGDAQPVQEFNVAHFGLERIIALGDGLDVYLAQKGPMNPVSVEEIASTPGFSGLKAVREGRVFLVDEALVSRPTPRLVDGIRAVAACLYPELQLGKGGQ